MPRTIKLAAIQMDGQPAPTAERLKRAAGLVQQAANTGANLVVLPELFNTGSSYRETNYEITERLSDQTMQWLCEQAQQHNIHIAGSLMVVDKDDTYNAAFLVAPDGTQWRYDKNFPYLWERVFFRDGRDGDGITVANTELGKIGILINWDAAHSHLWERYAAKVDLMLVLNNLQDVPNAALAFPDGETIALSDLGAVHIWAVDSFTTYLQHDIVQQGKWLGVPVVCAGMCGEFRSIFPAPFFSVGSLTLTRPDLWERVDKTYPDVELVAPYEQNTRIIGADGTTLVATTEATESVIVADVMLPDITPLPQTTQPKIEIPAIEYVLVDIIGAALYTLNYRRGVRRQWGARMAPIDYKTRVWGAIVLVVAMLSALVGYLTARKPKRRRK